MAIIINPQTNLQQEEPVTKGITIEKGNASYAGSGILEKYPYDSMNFTNIYKDDISEYAKYNVPTTRYFNWDEERAKNQGTGEKWVRGLAKAGVTTLGAVAENTLGVAFGIGEMVSGGAYYDNFIGQNVDKMNEAMRERFPNYRTQAELEASTWQKLGTANFWADTVMNGLGYSIGSIATMALTGGVGLIGKSAKAMALYNTSKALANGTKIAGAVEKGSRFTRQGFINLANMTEMGLYMSLAEASVEARETQKGVYEDLLNKELEERGFTDASQLSEVDLKGIEDASYAAGNRNFLTQLPVLAGTNLFMFGRTVAGFKPVSKVNKDVAFDAALNKTVSRIADQGIYRNALSRLKPTGQGALAEAGQEGWQFASNIIATDYHTDKYYDGGMASMTESLYKGITETLGSQEGLESMLVGAIVGGGMAGVRSTAAGEFKQRKAAAQYAADVINGGFMDNVNNKMLNYNAQAKVVADMENARRSGDIKAFKDAQFKLMQYNAFAALENGTYDVFREKLKDSKSLSDEDFAKAFGYDTEIALEEQTGGKSKSDVIKNLETKLDKFEKTYKNINEMFPPVPKTMGLPRMRMSEEERKAEDAVYNQRENLRAELILRASGIENRNERLENIQKQMKTLIQEAEKINGVKIKTDIDLLLNPGEDLLVDETGEYNAQEEVNIIAKTFDSIQQELVKKNALAATMPFTKLAEDYLSLFMDNSVSIEAYNKLSSSKYFQDLFEETVKANQESAKLVAKDKKAKEDIANAETSDQVNDAVPEDASSAAKMTAKQKRQELKRQEQEAERNYLKLNKNKSLKDQLKVLQSLAKEETNLSPTERKGLENAIKLLENKIKKNDTSEIQDDEIVDELVLDESTIISDENNDNIKNNKPQERSVPRKPKASSDKNITGNKNTSPGQLNIVSATNVEEVINVGTPEDPVYKVPVDENGNTVEPDPDTLDGKPILLEKDLLLKDNILEEEIELEIIENDWYKSDRLNKAEESWTEIPIYYKIGNAYVGKLEVSNNPERKAIVDKLQKGQRVTTKISSIKANNFNNTVNADTLEIHFHNPTETFGKEDDILLGFTSAVKEGDTLTYQWTLGEVHPDKNKLNELNSIKTEVQNDVTPGALNQIGIVIKKENNPEGIARMSIASTANLNAQARDKVLEALANKQYDVAAQIVASSELRFNANTNPSYLEFAEFEDGTKYIVYNSPKLGKLIRINENELAKGLAGQESTFHIVTEKNEKFVGPKSDTTKSKLDLAKDLTEFLETKKYNVDRDLGNQKTPYTSPVTDRQYSSYQEYLFSSKELGDEARVDGVGYNAILTTDITRKGESMFNSPRVIFDKGDLLGETAPEIIKNTKIAETSPEAPAAALKPASITVPTTKIISGGQTGVDQIGLKIGQGLGIETGGTVPKGFKTEDGSDLALSKFGVTESPSANYTVRTENNVVDSDGTVYFAIDTKSAGLRATKRFAKKHKKPFLLNPTAVELNKWLQDNNIKTLNVAGNRASKLTKFQQAEIGAAIFQAFTTVDPVTKKKIKIKPSDNSQLNMFFDDLGKKC